MRKTETRRGARERASEPERESERENESERVQTQSFPKTGEIRRNKGTGVTGVLMRAGNALRGGH